MKLAREMGNTLKTEHYQVATEILVSIGNKGHANAKVFVSGY